VSEPDWIFWCKKGRSAPTPKCGMQALESD